MKRRLIDRVSTLEQARVFVPQATPAVETVTLEDIRAMLLVHGFVQGPNESLAETCARALRTTYADIKQLAAMGMTTSGLKRLLDLVLNGKSPLGD